MARRNISLPNELDEEARRASLNVSALAQRAVAEELDRRRRMALLDALLDELDEIHGVPSAKVQAEAEAWVDSAVPVTDRRQPTRQRRRAAPRSRAAS